MPSAGTISQLEHRLATLGCPAAAVRRQVREIADHHEDLKLAALEEGLSELEAEARADQQLGDPADLAEHLALVLRQSSWWGRHPIVGFCLLPPLGFLLAWSLLDLFLVGFSWGLLRLVYGHSFTWSDLAAAVAADPDSFIPFFKVVNAMNYVAVALVAVFFCRLAYRSGSGLKWILAACAVSAAQGLFNQIELASHRISVGYGWPPNWGCAVIPMLVGAAVGAWQWRRNLRLRRSAIELSSRGARHAYSSLSPREARAGRGLGRGVGLGLRDWPSSPQPSPPSEGEEGANATQSAGDRLNSMPVGLHRSAAARSGAGSAGAPPSLPCPRPVFPRWSFATPTSLATTIVSVALVGLAGWSISSTLRREATLKELRTKIWPAERAAAVTQMRARQMTETVYETLIPLRPFVTAELGDSVASAPAVADNHLAGLPAGVHTFGGVPFEVTGRIQLMGLGFAEWNRVFPYRVFPSKVRNIPIEARCKRIFLLHGASFVGGIGDPTGETIGKLVLHYADHSQAEIPIVSGAHVLDWWGPVFETGARKERRFTTAPGTELAWAGTNPAIRRAQPENSLRLYKSTFANPRPDLTIISLDYVSTLTEAAPFLVGLTVE